LINQAAKTGGENKTPTANNNIAAATGIFLSGLAAGNGLDSTRGECCRSYLLRFAIVPRM
jgi:hypothetical protein